MLTLLAASAVASNPIVIDGDFNDWPPSAPSMLEAVASDTHVHLLLTLDGPPVNLQGLDQPLILSLDWDHDSTTGTEEGTDLRILFSQDGRGVKVAFDHQPPQSWDLAELVFAPTTASKQFELRLPRTLPGIHRHAGDVIRWTLRSSDHKMHHGRCAVNGPVPAPPATLRNRLPDPQDAVRIVSWNLEYGNLIKQAPVVKRLLASMQPDVILIQELEANQSEKAILDVLHEALPSRPWTLAMSKSGGRLRSGIASRLPTSDVPELQTLRRRGNNKSVIRAASLAVDVPHVGSVLMISAHLKCCGVAGGPEDLTRIGEVMALQQGIQKASQIHSFDALVIGGDLNLVGSRLPLELLTERGMSLISSQEQRDLLIARALQPDGSGTQTWQKRGQAYSPGTLDFILYSPNLIQQDAWVLDALDLPENALAAMSLVRTDTSRASDHLPLIIDLIPNQVDSEEHFGR